jgi:hypothetical protein
MHLTISAPCRPWLPAPPDRDGALPPAAAVQRSRVRRVQRCPRWAEGHPWPRGRRRAAACPGAQSAIWPRGLHLSVSPSLRRGKSRIADVEPAEQSVSSWEVEGRRSMSLRGLGWAFRNLEKGWKLWVWRGFLKGSALRYSRSKSPRTTRTSACATARERPGKPEGLFLGG